MNRNDRSVSDQTIQKQQQLISSNNLHKKLEERALLIQNIVGLQPSSEQLSDQQEINRARAQVGIYTTPSVISLSTLPNFRMEPQRDQQENDDKRKALLALLQGNQQKNNSGRESNMQRNLIDFQGRSIDSGANLAMRAASDAPHLQPYQLLAMQERQRRQRQQQQQQEQQQQNALKQSKQASAIEAFGLHGMNVAPSDPYLDRVMTLLASRDQAARDPNSQLQRLLLEQSALHRTAKLQETIRLLERQGGDHNRDLNTTASVANSSMFAPMANTVHNQGAGLGLPSMLSNNAHNVIANSLAGSQDLRLHPSSLLLGGDLSSSILSRYHPAGMSLGDAASRRFSDTGRMFGGSLLNDSISHLKRKVDEEDLTMSRMAKKFKSVNEKPISTQKSITRNMFPLPPVNIPNSNKNKGDEVFGVINPKNIKLASYNNTWKRLGEKTPKMQKELFLRTLGQQVGSRFGKKDKLESRYGKKQNIH